LIKTPAELIKKWTDLIKSADVLSKTWAVLFRSVLFLCRLRTVSDSLGYV
jgi:hypothetical protein